MHVVAQCSSALNLLIIYCAPLSGRAVLCGYLIIVKISSDSHFDPSYGWSLYHLGFALLDSVGLLSIQGSSPTISLMKL